MRLLVLLLSMSILAGCGNKDDVPRGIIPKADMEKILWDVIQADQFSAQYLKKDSLGKNFKTATMKLYEEIFQIHHVSKDQFQKSFQYYLAHPSITKIMLDSMSATANRQKMESYKKNSPKINPR